MREADWKSFFCLLVRVQNKWTGSVTQVQISIFRRSRHSNKPRHRTLIGCAGLPDHFRKAFHDLMHGIVFVAG